MNTRIESGLRIINLTIRLVRRNNIKLIICRNDKKDLPHLTISWQNTSKNIDIHLTRRTTGGNEHQRQLAEIPESDLRRICEAIGVELLDIIASNMRRALKVRPGWLARNGYMVLYLPSDVQEQIIRRTVPKKKRRGKWTHIVDINAMNGTNQPLELFDRLYKPAVLHDLAEIDYREPLLVVTGRKKCKRRLISLMLMTDSGGKRCWVRIDNLAREMLSNLEELMISSFKEILPGNAWETIRAELQLDEMGF